MLIVLNWLSNSHLLVKEIAAEDYKVDVSLTSACGQELAELQCAKEQQGRDATVHLSTVLLCLEAGIRDGKVQVTAFERQVVISVATDRLGADVSLRCRRSDVH